MPSSHGRSLLGCWVASESPHVHPVCILAPALIICILYATSGKAALKHPYVAQFHNAADEPGCPRILRIAIDDNTKYTAADYRERLYREIVRKKKDARARRAAAK